MPRYIDANKIEIKVERGINDDGVVFIPMRDVQRSIDRTPTADVVPKSEYDRLKKTFNELVQEAKGYLNRIYGIRADVAMEIFEDIDKRLDEMTVVASPDDCFITTFRKTMEKVTAEVDELKKKYMEV